jgi:methylglyoxal synthase
VADPKAIFDPGGPMKPSLKQRTQPMTRRKRIALIAHDNRKFDLLEWARYNSGTLERHVVHNVPIACNRATADFVLSSPLMEAEYTRQVWDYGPARDLP